MARALTLGEVDAPDIAGWHITGADEEAALSSVRPEIEELEERLKTLDGIKNRMGTLTEAEMTMTSGLSKEGYRVYRSVQSYMLEGTPKEKEAAKATAILWAKHADEVAKIMQKHGHDTYTAEDYMKTVAFDVNGKTFGLNNNVPGVESFNQVVPEIQSQIEKIRRQYKNTAQWMKAPNGKPTNLTEDQWLMVRTPAFKKWAGDWENAWIKNEVLTKKPLTITIPAGLLELEHGDAIKEANKIFRALYQKKIIGKSGKERFIPVVVEDRYGNEIAITRTGFSESISKNERKNERRIPYIVNNIRDIISEAYKFDQDIDRKGKNFVERFDYYVCRLNIDGDDTFAKITVWVDKNGKRCYYIGLMDYEIKEKDGHAELAKPANLPGGAQDDPSSLNHSIHKWANSVKEHEVKISVAETGEPLAVDVNEFISKHKEETDRDTYNQSASDRTEGMYRTLGMTADRRLADDVENWKKEVADIKNYPNQAPEERIKMPVVCSHLPLVFSLVNQSVGITKVNIDLPVIISKRHFYEILHVRETQHTHGHKDEMERAVIEDLPKLLANPVGIMKNFDEKGRELSGEVIALLEAKDKEGNVIVAPVSLREESSGAYRLKTFFGKRANANFTARFFNKENVLYADNKKRFSDALEQLAKNQALGVKLTYGESFYKGIPEKQDLVKLRNQHEGYYHLNCQDICYTLKNTPIPPDLDF